MDAWVGKSPVNESRFNVVLKVSVVGCYILFSFRPIEMKTLKVSALLIASFRYYMNT